MTVTCLHPNCELLLQRHRVCCQMHWFSLPEDMRHQINRASRGDLSVFGTVKILVTEYFASRLIGKHEIVPCRGKDCKADVIWLPTKEGKRMPVNPENVAADDYLFRHDHHVSHFADCPNADQFRRKHEA